MAQRHIGLKNPMFPRREQSIGSIMLESFGERDLIACCRDQTGPCEDKSYEKTPFDLPAVILRSIDFC
jgi:hypothetical protein